MSDASKSRKRGVALDWSRVRMKSRGERDHKVAVAGLGRVTSPGSSFADWFDALPQFLGAVELRRTVDAIVAARGAGRPVVFAFGGHVVKTGCSPLAMRFSAWQSVPSRA